MFGKENYIIPELFETDNISHFEILFQEAAQRTKSKCLVQEYLGIINDLKDPFEPLMAGFEKMKMNKINNEVLNKKDLRNYESKLLRFEKEDSLKTVGCDNTNEFQPTINASSQKIINRLRLGGNQSFLNLPAYIRLYLKSKRNRLENLISSQIKYYSPSQGKCQSSKNFLKRVDECQLLKNKNIKCLRDELEVDMTFKPEINEISKKLARRNLNTFYYKTNDKYQKSFINDDVAVNQFEVNTTYIRSKKPELNREMRKGSITRDKFPIKSELYMQKQSEFITRKKIDLKSQVKQSNTLKKGNLDQKVDNFHLFKSSYGDPSKIMDIILFQQFLKADAIDCQRQKICEKEMSQCTFQPATITIPERLLEKKLYQVKGINRFRELKSIELMQKDEKIKRITEAFPFIRKVR